MLSRCYAYGSGVTHEVRESRFGRLPVLLGRMVVLYVLNNRRGRNVNLGVDLAQHKASCG
jgi:hypothetical protein